MTIGDRAYLGGMSLREFIEAEGCVWDEGLAAIAIGTDTRYVVEVHKTRRDAIGKKAPEPELSPAADEATAHPDPIVIPAQLRRGDLRFVLVWPGHKGGMEVGWPKVANYPHDHVTLSIHIARRFPYGAFPAAGSRLVIIDADDVLRLAEVGGLDALPETFTVASGSSTPDHPKAHLYFAIEGEPLVGKRAFYDPETDADDGHMGEVFAQHPTGGKGFVIGPGSLHAITGRPYAILKDVPIATLPREAWIQFSNAVRWQKERPPRTERDVLVTTPHGESFGALLGLTVDQVWPVPADAEASGEWRKFTHPVHGSKNHNNLAVHRSGQAFYCHRCGSSGDALIALAVDAGIITCEDARPGCLASQAMMDRVKDAAKARGLPVDEAERKQHEAYLKAVLPLPYESVDIVTIRADIEKTIRAAAARLGGAQ